MRGTCTRCGGGRLMMGHRGNNRPGRFSSLCCAPDGRVLVQTLYSHERGLQRRSLLCLRRHDGSAARLFRSRSHGHGQPVTGAVGLGCRGEAGVWVKRKKRGNTWLQKMVGGEKRAIRSRVGDQHGLHITIIGWSTVAGSVWAQTWQGFGSRAKSNLLGQLNGRRRGAEWKDGDEGGWNLGKNQKEREEDTHRRHCHVALQPGGALNGGQQLCSFIGQGRRRSSP